MTNIEEHTQRAKALRDLADWIEAHPELPAPAIDVHFWLYRHMDATERLRAFMRAFPGCDLSGFVSHADGKKVITAEHQFASGVTVRTILAEENISAELFTEYFAQFFTEKQEPVAETSAAIAS